MPERAAAAFLNHLLTQNEWARERLRAFAGQRVEFRSPPLPVLRLVIAESGLIESIGTADVAPCDLVVTLSPVDLPRFLARDEEAIVSLGCEGPADLAVAVRDLARRLEWEFEEDLSGVFGDVLAHRIAGAGRDFIVWQKDAALRLAQNFAEYWTEESPLLARPAEAAAFARGVEAVRDECARLEERIARLDALLTRTRS